MNNSFNKNAGKSQNVTVHIRELRAQAHNHLAAAWKMLAPNAGKPQGQEDSLVGSLILGLLTWAPIMAGVEQAAANAGIEGGGMMDALANPAICAVMDGIGLLWDEEANKNRIRKTDMYPQGRRQDGIFGRPLNRRFNMVAVNDNIRLRRDAQGEIVRIAEVLTMLDKMESEGVTMVSVDTQMPLYDALKGLKTANRRNDGIRSFSMAMRKCA